MAQHYNISDYLNANADTVRHSEEPQRPTPKSLEQDYKIQPQRHLHWGFEEPNITTPKIDLLKILKVTSEKPTIVTDLIHSLPSDSYELVKPIQIILKIYDDEVLAIIPELELYSEGASEIEAIHGIKLEVLDLIEDLNETPDPELGTGPKAWKKALSLMVKRCQ